VTTRNVWNAATSEEYRARIKSDTLADRVFIDHRGILCNEMSDPSPLSQDMASFVFKEPFLAQAVMSSESSHEMKNLIAESSPYNAEGRPKSKKTLVNSKVF
jgi:hypothetical protein